MDSVKAHWERIYSTKQPHEVSWTQQIPVTSLTFIHDARLSVTDSIIDVGGGDSRLVDYLLDEGYQNITILDISEHAIQRAKKRLGPRAEKVIWIQSDIREFKPGVQYDFWHDRATFHFLTTPPQIQHYLEIARRAVRDHGYVTIGTFSLEGPSKCSGLDVRQYDEEMLTHELEHGFEKIRCVTEDHITPFSTAQNFLFCSFRRFAEN